GAALAASEDVPVRPLRDAPAYRIRRPSPPLLRASRRTPRPSGTRTAESVRSFSTGPVGGALESRRPGQNRRRGRRSCLERRRGRYQTRPPRPWPGAPGAAYAGVRTTPGGPPPAAPKEPSRGVAAARIAPAFRERSSGSLQRFGGGLGP